MPPAGRYPKCRFLGSILAYPRDSRDFCLGLATNHEPSTQERLHRYPRVQSQEARHGFLRRSIAASMSRSLPRISVRCQTASSGQGNAMAFIGPPHHVEQDFASGFVERHLAELSQYEQMVFLQSPLQVLKLAVLSRLQELTGQFDDRKNWTCFLCTQVVCLGAVARRVLSVSGLTGNKMYSCPSRYMPRTCSNTFARSTPYYGRTR